MYIATTVPSKRDLIMLHLLYTCIALATVCLWYACALQACAVQLHCTLRYVLSMFCAWYIYLDVRYFRGMVHYRVVVVVFIFVGLLI